jgi:hypothetical protein
LCYIITGMQVVYMNELFCLVASRDGKSRGRPCLIDGIFLFMYQNWQLIVMFSL